MNGAPESVFVFNVRKHRESSVSHPPRFLVRPRNDQSFSVRFILAICLLAYLGVSIALTLMLPYNVLAENTALATTFEQRGFKAGKYFVSIGAICGLSSSALGCLFPMPRILYSMGSDGVIFGFFSRVSERTGIPFIASISCGFLTALLALLFDLVSLVEMMSIGTLLAYTIVALCVLLLRYKPGSLWIVSSNIDDTSGNLTDSLDIGNEDTRENGQDGPDLTVKSRVESFGQQTTTYPDGMCDIVNPESEGLVNDVKKRSTTRRPEWMSTFSQRLIAGHLDQPTSESYSIVRIAVALFVVLSVALESCLIWWLDALLSRNPFAVIPFVLILVSLLVVTELIGRQPQSKNELPFKVPLVPVTPLLAIFINTYLILMLSYVTWIRFAVWMVIGENCYWLSLK